MTRGAPVRLALEAVLALTLLAAPGLAAQQGDAAAGIAATNAALSAGVAAGDAEAVVALYTTDAMLMAPNAPAATGHAAIGESFHHMMEMVGSITLTTDELQAFGDVAHEVGRYVLEGKDGSHLDHGKYIVIWHRTADGWKLHRDIFNSDMAPPAGG